MLYIGIGLDTKFQLKLTIFLFRPNILAKKSVFPVKNKKSENQHLLIAISMVLLSIFLIKTSILVFHNSIRLSYDVRKYQKINLLALKGSRNSGNMNIL